MMPPLLLRKLELEDAYRVPDDAGGYETDWRVLGVHWAEIRSGRGAARNENGLSLSRVPLRIIIRGAPIGSPKRPHAGQRFREGTRVYAIRSVTEMDAQGRYLVCQAEAEASA